MMNILLDTNVMLNIVRVNDYNGILRFINPEDTKMFISIASEAEIRSFALRKRWGVNKLDFLTDFLDRINIVEISQFFVSTYTEIDAYSQRLNPNFSTYPFDTPRNMGKNDLWIASLAAMLSLRLITTDGDFDHLDNVFFEVRKIKPEEFIRFF